MSAIPPQASVWDERRNTSRVFRPPPYALQNALTALERWRIQQPEHARWIEAGYPNLTEKEHREWFSSDYVPARSKRRT